MVSKKDRRHSGWVTPRMVISKKEMIEHDLFLEDFYDDWEDYRDGMRDWFSDFKLIKNIHGKKPFDKLLEKRVRMNKKQEKLLVRRKKKKSSA
ncbi:MAG: hypothetical protein WC595_06685 [Candidatus Nanoarchaeia archaeon]